MARDRNISSKTRLYRLNHPKTLKMVREEYHPMSLLKEAQSPDTGKHGSGIADLIARLPVMVLAWDERGQLILWNREAEKLSGFTAQELLTDASLVNRILGPHFASRVQELWQEHSSAAPTWWAELAVKDGQRRLILWSLPARRLQVPGWRWWVLGLPLASGAAGEAS